MRTTPQALAVFVASAVTATAIVAMGLVASASAGAPIHLRQVLVTWVGVGGVALVVSRLLHARPSGGRLGRAELGWSALAGLGLAAVGTGALALEHALIPRWRPYFELREAMLEPLLRPGDLAALPLVLVVVAVGPAIVEELLFRGVLRRYLARGLGRTGRVLALSVLFSLMHADLTVLLPMLYVGAILTLIAERTGGWLAAAVAHFVLNAVNVTLFAHVFPDAELGVWAGLASLAVGTAIATAAVARIRDGFRPRMADSDNGDAG